MAIVCALDWLNEVDASIFAIDAVGNVIMWNRAIESLLGFTSDEIVNGSLSTLVYDDDANVEIIAGCRDGSAEHFLRMKSKDGPPIDVRIKTAVQRNQAGEFISLVCFAERKQVKVFKRKQLQASLQRPHMNLHEVSVMLFSLDASGIIDLWNEKSVELTGYSKEEAIGGSFLNLVGQSPSDGAVSTTFQRAMTSAGESSFIVEICTKFSLPLQLIVRSTERLDRDGQRIGTLFAAHCVTEMDSYERSIETKLLDKANLPVFGVDVDGNVNQWNDKMHETTGFSKESALDRSFVSTFVVTPLHQTFQEIVDKGLEGYGTCGFEFEFRTVDGDVRYLLLNASTRRDIIGNIVGVLFVGEDVTEHVHHSRATAAVARELRQLVDTSNAPIFGIDVDGMVNEWNEKMADITGFTGDEAFNRPLIETFIAPAIRDPVQETFDEALRGTGTSNYDLEFLTKNKESRHLLVSATTRRDVENTIIGVVCVGQDVTETSKHDRAVASMASELRQLIDTSVAPIFGIDRDGDVNEWNNTMTQVTGFTKEEAFDCNLVEKFIVPSLRGSVQEVIDNALKGEGRSNYELEFRTKSNEIRHLLINATTRRDAENNVVGVVAVSQDVTEAVRRDQAVASMANELRQLIDTANAPIFGIGVDGNVNEWNNKTAEVTGYLKEEAFDESLVEKFIAPAMRHQVAEIMNKALAGHATSNYEVEIIAKSKEIRVLLVNATTRRDQDHNIVGVVGVAQDVTEDRKHSRQLREMQYLRASQDAKVETERNMTAYFAHELRNPLGAIDSALHAMPAALPESVRTLVSGMQLCTAFMSSIMNNLLDVRKMEEGKMTLHNAPISLRATLDSIHRMLLPSVRRNVEFLVECQTADRDWVHGDSHRLQQVMTNVVTNAIKYTVCGSITLSVRWIENSVCFSCEDTGPGIPKSEQKKLFERYVQRGGAPGTGLGLAIAKHLVELMAGDIRFDSDPSVKPGTSCIVTLPLIECAAPDVFVMEDDKVIESEVSFLIVDDVKMNRVMLARRIKMGIAPNAVVKEASTGEEALLICGTEKFDVIVVDQYMEEAGGVMVGTDVVFAMRRMRIDSIVIGCSGNDIDQEFIEAGADWVWKKPMPPNSKIISDLRSAMMRKGRDV